MWQWRVRLWVAKSPCLLKSIGEVWIPSLLIFFCTQKYTRRCTPNYRDRLGYPMSRFSLVVWGIAINVDAHVKTGLKKSISGVTFELWGHLHRPLISYKRWPEILCILGCIFRCIFGCKLCHRSIRWFSNTSLTSFRSMKRSFNWSEMIWQCRLRPCSPRSRSCRTRACPTRTTSSSPTATSRSREEPTQQH